MSNKSVNIVIDVDIPDGAYIDRWLYLNKPDVFDKYYSHKAFEFSEKLGNMCTEDFLFGVDLIDGGKS